MKIGLIVILCLLAQIVYAQQPNYANGRDCDEPWFPAYNKKTRLYGFVDFTGKTVIPPTFIKAYGFEGKYALVLQGTRYGFVNCEGTIVTSGTYDEVRQFYYGRFWGLKSGKWGLYDIPSRELVPATFDDIRPIHPRKSLTWFKRNEKWGLFDRDAVKYIVAEKYDAVQSISDSNAFVRKGAMFALFDYQEGSEVLDSILLFRQVNANNYSIYRKKKWGIISRFGRSIVPPQYDSIISVAQVYLVRDGAQYGVISNLGKEILRPVQDGFGVWNEGYIPYRKGNLWGISAFLKVHRIEPQFKSASMVFDSFSIVEGVNGKKMLWNVRRNRELSTTQNFTNFYRNERNGKLVGVEKKQHFLIDKNGLRLTGFPADSIYVQDTVNFMRVKYNNKFKLLNGLTGSLLEGSSWKKIDKFYKGFMAVADTTGYTWLLNGKEISKPARYDSVQFINSTSAYFVRVWKGGKAGLCYPVGNDILPMGFSAIVIDGDMLKVKKGEKWGLYNLKGEELVSTQYGSMSISASKVLAFPAIVKSGSQYVLLNKLGKELGSNYHDLRYLGEGYFGGFSKKDAVLVKGDGTEIKMKPVDDLGMCSEYTVAAKLNNKWGFLTYNGTFLIQPIYEEVLPFIGKTTFAKLNGKWGSINKQGKVMMPFQYSGYSVLGGIRILVP